MLFGEIPKAVPSFQPSGATRVSEPNETPGEIPAEPWRDPGFLLSMVKGARIF